MLDNAAHLLVVDDDRRLRDLLSKFLKEAGYRVTAAASAGEAREHLQALEFDLLILDVMMPGESGLDLTRDLRRTRSVPIMMLTAMGEIDDRVAGLDSGADDYLSKPFEPRELLARIGAILRRAATAAPPPAETEAPTQVTMGTFAFDLKRGELLADGAPVKLSQSEADLLALFCAHPGAPFSRTDLAGHLGVSAERSIDVQVTRLRRKIEQDPKQPRYLRTVRGVGYELVPD